MNLADFRRYRDQHALDHYRAELPRLREVRDRLYERYQDRLIYLRWAKERKDRNEVDHLQYELYGDYGLAILWAEVDARIMCMEADILVRLARLRPKVIPLFEGVNT